jgi:hypothetical protein
LAFPKHLNLISPQSLGAIAKKAIQFQTKRKRVLFFKL